MGMLSLVAEGSIPAEVVQLNVHGGGDAIAIDAEQVPPCFGIVAAKACGVLPVRREDVRPDVAGVVLQFRYGGVQVHTIRVTEQAMVTQSFCTRTCCDVFHVTIRLLHLLPVFLQRQGDERRGIFFRPPQSLETGPNSSKIPGRGWDPAESQATPHRASQGAHRESSACCSASIFCTRCRSVWASSVLRCRA